MSWRPTSSNPARTGVHARRAAGFMLLPVVLLLSLIAAAAYLGNREIGLNSAMAVGATDQDKARAAAEAGLHRAIVQMHTKGCTGIYPIVVLSPVKDTAFDGGSYNAYAMTLSGSPTGIVSTGTYGDASITLTRTNVPMHQAATTTMTLQPDAAGIDTYLDTANSSGNATKQTMLATTGQAFPILRFDLSAIPAGSHVTSATLSAYASGGSGSGQITLYRPTRDWTEAANWSTSNGSTAWTTAGGDYHATPVAATTYAGAGSWLNWDVTALADRWSKGSLPNQGVLMQAPAGLTGLTLTSSDSATAAQRPKLAVTFLPPCGWTPPATTVTLNPAADVDINKDIPTTNFGADPELFLSKGYEAHPLLQFDLSGIAAGKTVKSATLRMYFSRVTVNALAATKTSKSLTLEVHTVSKAWKEMEAHWVRRIIGTNWTTQGGDYLSTVITNKSLSSGTAPGIWLEFTVTPLVQEWVDGVTANNGLLLILPTTSTEELIFSSREAATNKPELVVTYQ